MTDADFLALTLAGHPPIEHRGETPWLTWEWLDEGVIQLLPRRAAQMSLVLSAGVHGNETAPVELVNILLAELMAGRMPLAPRLLVIFGNPQALRAGKRYLDYDMNRLFAGGATRDKTCGEVPAAGQDLAVKKDQGLSRRTDAQPDPRYAGPVLHKGATMAENNETLRCQLLQGHLGRFFRPEDRARWHLDLHTAIRGSYHVRFGLLPYQPAGDDPALLHWLNAAELDALVRHRAAGSTFTHYSSTQFSAASVTLELGKALPFGANDLDQFSRVQAALRALINGGRLPERLGPPMKKYRVSQQIDRTQADFALTIPADALNFTVFNRGELLAKETGREYRVQEAREWVLFPNPNVAMGLRAGLMLVEDEDNRI
ncbi:succinylglutamate desuccinylase [Sodalis sp. dw_96]|uniref:succinylglutamate desuccinylase n=1 Tax=Sodalis sp. dw_96 TaxID=2719794 RepID=UPI00210679AF|nr:succinylglutamate desuccinylase [Sodalis sp. dw_96]